MTNEYYYTQVKIDIIFQDIAILFFINLVVTFSLWNFYENVPIIMGQRKEKFYLCPIITDTFSI